MLFVKRESLLSSLEKKAFAKLQEKTLDLVDDGRLEVGLGILMLFVQPEKLQHQRFLEQVLRPGNSLAFMSELAGACGLLLLSHCYLSESCFLAQIYQAGIVLSCCRVALW